MIKDYIQLDESSPSGLSWKIAPANRVKVGDPVGSISQGYYKTEFKGQGYLCHRLVYWLVTGENPEIVDHKDTNTLNNVFNNLRGVNSSQSACNTKSKNTSLTGVKGVTFCKRLKKWKGRVMLDGKSHYLGMSDDLKSMTGKVVDFRNQLHKEFARHD